MAEGIRRDWRALCAAAANEPDPERLALLVNQIIQAIDEQHRADKALTGLLDDRRSVSTFRAVADGAD